MTFGIVIYSMYFRGNKLTISYDDEGDLDEKTIIGIIDLHFTIGDVPEIKDEFNRYRKRILSLPSSDSQVAKYVKCVLEFD